MRHSRPLRTRIFLGCQGDSERSYGTFLHRLVANEGRLHIDAVLLQPGAGDPLDTVRRAKTIIREKERRDGSPYKYRAVILDRDQIGLSPDRDAQIPHITRPLKIRLIWQTPCHESFLLRHIEGCQTLRPSTSGGALAQLCGRWPDYHKGMPADYLLGKISFDDLRRVCTVERELAQFLDEIGYFRHPASAC